MDADWQRCNPILLSVNPELPARKNSNLEICSPTVCGLPCMLLWGIGAGAGADSVWEQKKLEARKLSGICTRLEAAVPRPVHYPVIFRDAVLCKTRIA